ncbi:Uncharacterised protein [Salmonella enterica subsp. enterica serovar Bovismorbificans]|uniref:Uncharacterized protein n=1 Tax=Salmonella enterica subsp. enterica serovar Bovismorbificans TaxID=58097 RepID=A0A655DAM7_SALET|nr:Uncharacterised protein [Salmonella enterica subsp. enterica serovar Bovismorbificans]
MTLIDQHLEMIAPRHNVAFTGKTGEIQAGIIFNIKKSGIKLNGRFRIAIFRTDSQNNTHHGRKRAQTKFFIVSHQTIYP